MMYYDSFQYVPRKIQYYQPMPGEIRGRVLNPPTEPDGEPISIEEAVEYAERQTQHNRDIVEHDRLCGCAHCLNFFEGSQIKVWVDVSEAPGERYQDTAACPYCGHDAVLGSLEHWPMSVPFFLALHQYIYPGDSYNDPRMIVFGNSVEEEDYAEREAEMFKCKHTQPRHACKVKPAKHRVTTGPTFPGVTIFKEMDEDEELDFD